MIDQNRWLIIIEHAKNYKSLLVITISYRDWLFHPAIRLYTNPHAKASIFRYPSPGNTVEDPIISNEHTDFKTPYEHTRYNVRYLKPVPSQLKDKEYTTHLAPLTVDPITKYTRINKG